jgi:hypothetical protein
MRSEHETKRMIRNNLRLAKQLLAAQPTQSLRRQLEDLTIKFGFSLVSSDIQPLGGHWYVTHSGLLRLAARQECAGICSRPIHEYCDVVSNRWVFEAIVYRSVNCKGFVGHGDADPSNVSSVVRGAELRIAETRAVNRALRKAYGIGLCSVEELGAAGASLQQNHDPVRPTSSEVAVASSNGHRKLRDRLSELIRHYGLDPQQVRTYALEFCGTPELRSASREQLESFFEHLAEWAQNDHGGLVYKLNSYATPTEAHV